MLHSIFVDGVGPHRDRLFEFRPGLNIIRGDNGSGKTFGAESFMAVTSGDYPSRGAIYDYIAGAQATIATKFDIGADVYEVKRVANKGSRESKGELIKNGASVYSGGVTGLERLVTDLIGDRDIILASSFCSQERAKDIVGATAGERKALLRRMFGMEQFPVLSKRASDKQQIALQFIEVESGHGEQKRVRLGELQKAIAIPDTIIFDIEVKRGNIADDKTAKERMESALDEIRKRLADASGDVRFDRIARLKDDNDKAKDEIALSKKGIERSQGYIDSTSVLSEIAKLESLATEATPERIAGLKELVEVKIPAARTEVVEAQVDFDNINEGVARATREAMAAENLCEKHDRECINCERAITNISDRSICLESENEYYRNCRFLKDGLEAKNRLPIVAEILKEARHALTKANLAKEQSAGRKDEDGKRLKLKQAALAGLEKGNPAQKLQQLLLADSQLSEKRGQVRALEEKKERLQVMVDLQTNRDKELQLLQAECADVTAAFKKLEGEKVDIEAQIAQADKDIETHTATLNALLIKKAMNDQNIAEHKHIDCEIAEAVSKCDQLKHQAERFGLVAECFSPTGAQALIFDYTLPEIEGIVKNLFERAGLDWSLEFHTQKAIRSRKGELSETLDIMVSTEGGAGLKRVEDLSGGERQLIRVILRIAIAMFIRQSASAKLDFMVFDEPFDALAESNCQRVSDMFDSLDADKILPQIIIVTHSEAVMNLGANVIEL